MIVMIVTTPDQITAEILSFCGRISPEQVPLFLDVRAGPDAEPLECFENARRKVSKDGGDVQYGWRIWVWPDVMVEAEFHAVWKSPTGELVDISPSEEKKHLFLPDDTRKYDGVSLNNIREALSSDSDIQEFVDLTHRMYELITKQKQYPGSR